MWRDRAFVEKGRGGHLVDVAKWYVWPTNFNSASATSVLNRLIDAVYQQSRSASRDRSSFNSESAIEYNSNADRCRDVVILCLTAGY